MNKDITDPEKPITIKMSIAVAAFLVTAVIPTSGLVHITL